LELSNTDRKKRKLKKTESNNSNAAPKAVSVTTQQALEAMLSDLPRLLDHNDTDLGDALLMGLQRDFLHDMAGFYVGSTTKENDTSGLGPPKFMYSEDDDFDNFMYYAGQGCPNCGATYSFDLPEQYCTSPNALVCLHCGHRAAPLHFWGESDSLVDRLASSLKTCDTATSEGTFVRGIRKYYRFGEDEKKLVATSFQTSGMAPEGCRE